MINHFESDGDTIYYSLDGDDMHTVTKQDLADWAWVNITFNHPPTRRWMDIWVEENYDEVLEDYVKDKHETKRL